MKPSFDLKKFADPKKLAKLKIKKYLIIGLLGFFALLLILIIIVIIFSAVYSFAQEAVQDIDDFFNKLGNFITFNGWCKDSECTNVAMNDYYTELDEVNNSYKSNGVEIDINLITGTIFYDKYDYSIAPQRLPKGDEDEGLSDEEKEFISFYKDAKGKISTLASKMVSGTYLNFKQYKQYLIDDYIPDNFKDKLDKLSDENKKYEIEKIADQMMASATKKDQSDLAESQQDSDCELAETTTETVDIDTSFVEGLKIKILHKDCKNDAKCTNVEYESIDFKDYVMGVVYREIGVGDETPIEAIKANIIAAKSFTLRQRKPVGGYITMINNTYEQTYCNLDTGCNNYNSNPKPKPSSTIRQKLSEAYDAVINEYLYDVKDKKFIGFYRDTKARCASDGYAGKCLGQNDSKSLARQGKSYNEILSTFYTGNIGIIDIGTKTVSFNVYDCLEYSSNKGLLTGGNYSSTAPVFANEKSFFANVNYKYYKSKAEAGRNYGECPWYAKGRAIEIVAYSNMPDDLKNKVISSLRNTYGNGADWYKNPSSTYFGKSTNLYAAKPGSIVSWSGGKSVCSGGCGHVGIIEDVKYDSNGKATQVLLTDGYNGTGNPANAHYNSRWMSIEKLKIYSTRRSYRFNGYVYLLG